MKNTLILILLFCFSVQAQFSSTRQQSIDQINQSTGTDIILNPTNDVLTGSIAGGSSSGGDLTLKSTSHATKGEIYIDGIPLKQFTNNSASTGLHDGGSLSINADTTKFDISAGDGHIINSYTDPNNPTHADVAWSAFTAQVVTNIATHEFTHIYITSAGAILQSTVSPTPQLRRDNIYLGKLVHPDNINVIVAADQPEVGINIGNAISDYWKALGMVIVSGNRISANGVNLSFDKSEGDIHQEGINYQTNKAQPNIKTLAVQTPVTFRYRTQTGVGTGDITVLNPTVYDNAGAVTAIGGSSNQATNVRIYLFNSGSIRVQYGQEIYSTLAKAVEGLTTESFIKETNIADNATLVATISVIKGAIDLSDVDDAKISHASKFGEISLGTGASAITTLQGAYDNSTTPEIIVDSTRGAVTIQDNATPLGAKLFEVQINGGAANYFSVDVDGMETSGATINGRLDVVSTTEGSRPCPPMTEVQRDAIASPNAGDCVYNSDTSNLNFHDGSIWGEISGGGDANRESTYNYITNGKIEDDTSGWAAYCNTTASVEPDDFGGTVGTLIAIARNTTTPLKEVGDLNITTDAANSLGCGVYYDFNITRGSTQSIQRFISDIDSSGTNVDDGDFRMYIMSSSDNFVANYNLIHSGIPEVPAGFFEGYFKSFQTHPSDLDYRIIVHVATSETNTLQLLMDDIQFRKQIMATGPPSTGWQDYTPTLTGFGTPASTYFQWRREGPNLEIKGKFVAGTTTSVDAKFTLPGGLVMDSSIPPAKVIGKAAAALASATNSDFSLVHTGASDTDVYFGIYNNTAVHPFGNALGINVAGTGGVVAIEHLTVPILGWGGTSTMTSDVSSRNIVVIGAGNDGTGITSANDLNFTVVEDLTSSFDGTSLIAPETGYYPIDGMIDLTASVLGHVLSYIDSGAGPVFSKRLGEEVTNDQHKFSGFEKLNKDDVLTFRFNGTATLENITNSHYISISKKQSPQTRFDNERISATYNSNAGQPVTTAGTFVIFEDLVNDDTGSYDTGTGDYEVKVSGIWRACMTTRLSTAVASQQSIYFNGTIRAQTNAAANTANVACIEYPINKGEIIKFRVAPSSNTNLNAQAERNFISISRVK